MNSKKTLLVQVLDLNADLAESSGMLSAIKDLLRNDPSCDVRCNCVYVCLQKETEADLVADTALVYNLLASLPVRIPSCATRQVMQRISDQK